MVNLLINFSSIAHTTLIYNVKGHSINQHKLLNFSALAFANGKIVAVGEQKKLLNKFPNAMKIDGKGQSLLPGLHDAHGHVLSLARMNNEVNLTGATSVQMCLDRIQSFIDQHPEKKWVLGRGWNQALWKNHQFPTAKDLDSLNTDKLIWLRRIDGHAAWANSVAMKFANTHAFSNPIEGGEIMVDKEGKQTGIFIDNAMNIVNKSIMRDDDIRSLLVTTLNYLATLGITAVDDAGIDKQTYHAYRDLADEKKLPIRVNAMLASEASALAKMLNKPYADEFLQIRTIKYMLDGALGSRGAALLAPYSDRPNKSGKLVQSQAFLEKTIFAHAKDGWQAAIHAIGDKANHIALQVLSDKRALSIKNRNRIEHAQVVALEDLDKFTTHAIIASMQPTHATSDKNMAQRRIGKQRLKGAYAWKTLLDKGVTLAFGSDFPVEFPNPFYGIHAAVTRQDHDNQPVGGWIPAQRISLTQAFSAFTIDAAFANRQEDKIGSLEVGKNADFILLNQDIFSIDAQHIWRTKVLQTWVAGKKLYQR